MSFRSRPVVDQVGHRPRLLAQPHWPSRQLERSLSFLETFRLRPIDLDFEAIALYEFTKRSEHAFFPGHASLPIVQQKGRQAPGSYIQAGSLQPVHTCEDLTGGLPCAAATREISVRDAEALLVIIRDAV